MVLNFPNRLTGLLIALVIFLLMQSGCMPIQAPTATPPAKEEAARPTFSTNVSNESASPDGNWIATTLFQVPRASEEYYQSLIVSHISGLPTYKLVEGRFPMALGYTLAEPLMWSQDGNRFYYTNRANPDGCGLLYNGSDLYQVDLASGKATELLPANTTTKLALSPNEDMVAYLAIGEPTLLLHDLASDEITPFDLAPLLAEAQVGAFVWSPESDMLAFAVAHQPCMGGWAEATSIYTLDTTDLTLVPHLEDDEMLMIPQLWLSDEILLLENQSGETFTLDLTTGQVSLAPESSATSTTTITATTTVSQ